MLPGNYRQHVRHIESQQAHQRYRAQSLKQHVGRLQLHEEHICCDIRSHVLRQIRHVNAHIFHFGGAKFLTQWGQKTFPVWRSVVKSNYFLIGLDWRIDFWVKNAGGRSFCLKWIWILWTFTQVVTSPNTSVSLRHSRSEGGGGGVAFMSSCRVLSWFLSVSLICLSEMKMCAELHALRNGCTQQLGNAW